jgi:adenosylmethionine-8-amino-7-oxononanoate aminotransferase
MAKAYRRFEDHPHVGQVRQTGMILAIEIVADKSSRTNYPWQQRRGLRVYGYGLANGALLQPLGDVIYFMPPYVISLDEIDQLAQIAWHRINIATAD